MKGGEDIVNMPPMPPAQPMGNEQDNGMAEDMPMDDANGNADTSDNGDSNELQSDAASLGQKLSGAESSEIKSVINQILGTCAGNLSSKDVNDIKKKLDDKGGSEDTDENEDDMPQNDESEAQPQMPTESKKHSNKFLNEIIDSIINKDDEAKKDSPKIPIKIKKKNPFSGRK
jgi:hypothetical protein